MVAYAPILGVGGILHVAAGNTGLSWIIFVAVAALLVLITILMNVAMPKFKQMQTLVDRLNLVSREILTDVYKRQTPGFFSGLYISLQNFHQLIAAFVVDPGKRILGHGINAQFLFDDGA